MLHPWIKIKDVFDLLQDMPSIDGMISKRDFQKALLKCKEHKQPLKKIEKIKSYKVRNAHEIIRNIHEYKRNFKGGVFISELKKIQHKREEFAGLDFDNAKIEIYQEQNGSRVKLDEKDTIFEDWDVETTLIEILKISKSTYRRWRDCDIIQPKIFRGTIVKINNREIPCVMNWYSLADIKETIRNHR